MTLLDPECVEEIKRLIGENESPRAKGRGIKDKNKMLKLTNPRLRRFNVMVNSFNSCISNTSKEFSRTPEMSFSEMSSKPGMFFEKLKGTITFKQLKSFANAHSCWELNKQMDVVGSYVQLINFEPLSVSNLPKEKFTIHSEPVELKGISCIFNFPDKMESILSKAMFSGFQIHFLSPEIYIRNKVLTISDVYFKEPSISAPNINY